MIPHGEIVKVPASENTHVSNVFGFIIKMCVILRSQFVCPCFANSDLSINWVTLSLNNVKLTSKNVYLSKIVVSG